MSGMVEALNRAAAAWWEWTVASTGQGALLLLLVVLTFATGRFLRPGLRYGLLLVVLLKFAVPPVFGVAYGFSDLLVRAFTNEPAPLVNSDLRVTVETAPALATPSPTVPAATFRPQATVLSTKAWLLLLEGAGAAVIVFLIARQCLVARSLIWNGAVADETLQGRFHAMTRSLKLRRTPRLCLSDEARAPQSGGILRPFVLLPTWAATMPEEELDILLAHELAHVRRMDALVNGIQAAAQALLWWNPAVWWLNRRIREEREFCCDDLVLSQGIASGAAYSRTLVNVAERVSLPQSSWAMAGMADNFGAIDRRVRRALESGPSRRGWRHYAALGPMLLLAGWVLPGATDGAEKEFDAVWAARVESEFRIHEINSDKVGRDVNGAFRRHGNVSFVVHSPGPMLEALHVTAKGEFLYPNAAGETNKCVVTGEIKASYLGMSFATARLVLDKDGVVDFGKATLDSEAIEGMTSESIVLDLRDGKFAMQDGKADSIKAVKLAERKAKPADLGMDVKAGKMTGNHATGVLTSLEDATVILRSSAEDGDVTIQGKLLRLSDFDKGDGSGVFEGDMQATHSEFSLTATRLERGETLLFNNATLETMDFGTINAEQVRVDPVARRFDILNGTVDEARLNVALGEDAKNAAKGEWLSLPFKVLRKISVEAFIFEVDRKAELNLPGALMYSKEDDYPEQGSISEGEQAPKLLLGGTASDEEWSVCNAEILKLVDSGRGKVLASPRLTTLDGQEATISVGTEVPYTVRNKQIHKMLGTKLRVIATIVSEEDGAESLEIDVNYTHTKIMDPDAKRSNLGIYETDHEFRMKRIDEPQWCFFMPVQSGDRLELVAFRVSVVQPGSAE